MIKAVLFDMDGLLVDTEPLNVTVVTKICDELGIDLTPEEKHYCASGITNRKFYSELFNNRKSKFDLNEVLNRTFKTYDDLLKTEAKYFSGAINLPKLLSEKYKLGLVSGSTRNQVNIILSKLDIENLFEVVVTADDITSSKPDPEGYLLAANKLNISPHECLVLEDGEQGVKAAKSAGMKVVGVINNSEQNLSLADLIVKDLTEVNQDLLSKI